MAENWRAPRADRLRSVNALIQVIACLGRRFFRDGARVSRIEMDERGRLWYQDCYFRADPQYLHNRHAMTGRWSIGGTLRDLVLAFKRHIMTGDPINPRHLGPWPDWYSDGDPWGNGLGNMEIVRTTARSLGILAADKEHQDLEGDSHG